MAEHCALSTAMREVLPLRDTVQAIGRGLRIDESCLTTFHVTIWEDDMGALTLANLDPGQSTPRSKFYDSKAHWFRSHLNSSMQVRKVDAKEQLGDLFTKPLVRDAFQYLRGQLMGW